MNKLAILATLLISAASLGAQQAIEPLAAQTLNPTSTLDLSTGCYENPTLGKICSWTDVRLLPDTGSYSCKKGSEIFKGVHVRTQTCTWKAKPIRHKAK